MPMFSVSALLRALAVWGLIILAETVQGTLRLVRRLQTPRLSLKEDPWNLF